MTYMMKNIRNFVLALVMIMAGGVTVNAQSMSDEQVMQFVVTEYNNGTSQSQIVTKLMQKGVDINQIRRVRQKYERQVKNGGLGIKDITGEQAADNRMRTNNGKDKNKAGGQMQTQKNLNLDSKQLYTDANPNFTGMQDELGVLLPDSLLMSMQEKGGRKVFGRDIFNNKELTFEPNMNIATPQNYRLGPGDAVFVDIYGASQKSIQATVTPDGTIVLEGFGPVTVSGLTVAQANARLKATLGARYSSSKVRLTVGQTKTIMVNVMGEVAAPGTYTLSAFASVFHALYMAGGTNDIGTLRNIKVYRNNKLVTTVDIYDYILNGKLTGNVRLADNDVIVVGPYDCLVNVTGKVKRPMFYEMKRNESVGTLLKYAGGFTGDAYKKTVKVIRKSGSKYSIFNVGEFDVSSFKIEDEDSIAVDSVIPRYSNMVEVRGAVFRPGMYQVGGEITGVRSLLEHADGVTEDAFLKHAVMHRLKFDRTLEVIQADVVGIVSGRVADISLKNEDVLYIPSE